MGCPNPHGTPSKNCQLIEKTQQPTSRMWTSPADGQPTDFIVRDSPLNDGQGFVAGPVRSWAAAAARPLFDARNGQEVPLFSACPCQRCTTPASIPSRSSARPTVCVTASSRLVIPA